MTYNIYILESQVRDRVKVGHIYQHEYRVGLSCDIGQLEESPDLCGFNRDAIVSLFGDAHAHDNRESAVREAVKRQKRLRDSAIATNDEISFLLLPARFPTLSKEKV